MKLTAKIILSIVAIYIVIWIALAGYFSFADRHKELLESNLSTLFQREVTIESVQTNWDGLSPTFVVNGFSVAGDDSKSPALSFSTLSAKVDPVSLLLFWPSFTQFEIDRPEVEIANLDNGLLQIAGIKLNSNQSVGLNPRRVLSWLLNNKNANWENGSIVWRRLNGDINRYDDISFDYQREQQSRSMTAAVNLPEGRLAFNFLSNGDLINTSDWDASLEILGDQGESYLAPDDFALTASAGKGQMLLKQLSVQKIQDFLYLTGIGGGQNWLMQSELTGTLSNAEFVFSGPLFNFNEWSLSGDASNIGFKAKDGLLAMNNLNGSISASSSGGEFLFSTKEAELSWYQWFDKPFPIDASSGKFVWDLSEDDKVTIRLSDANFRDKVVNIDGLSAVAEITKGQTRITNLADLFTTSSIQNLDFEADGSVNQPSGGSFAGSIFLDASAKFEVSDAALVGNYFPKDPRISKFREWWENGVLAGTVTYGSLSYQGNVSTQALSDGDALLTGKANYSGVELDYGYGFEWPIVSNASGVMEMQNSTLSFISNDAEIEDIQVQRAQVDINSIFTRDRSIVIDGAIASSMPKVMDFIFDGPLINKNSPTYSNQALPITSDQGLVDASLLVIIPLNDVKSTTVQGRATVQDGRLKLPNDVPVTNISGLVNFTERTVESDNIEGDFLGGRVDGRLTTTEPAQPPVLKLEAEGTANVADLKPWIGEHMLSWMDGLAEWQGVIDIDGPQAKISASSNLQGVTVTAPAPLSKSPSASLPLQFDMTVGSNVEQSLTVRVGDDLYAQFLGDETKSNQLLDKSIISLGGNTTVKEGVNFDINSDEINLDNWLQAIIELTEIKVSGATNTDFLDAMRSVKIAADDPYLLGRKFGPLELSAVSADGGNWIGSLSGSNIDGIIQAEPRASVGSYRLNLSKLHIPEGPKEKPPLAAVDYSLTPETYPIIDMNVNSFQLVRKQLGRLKMRGEPVEGAWALTSFDLNHQGVQTTAKGQWVNTKETGTITSFDIETEIDEAGGALQELDMGGFVSRGDGTLSANINWIGAPHEFDYSRLNGDFDLRVQDGELVKIEPGTGKLLGLLNFNAIARRLTLDFSDVFSSGLEFDRMRYVGVLADGEAILNQAYIFTPAVFVNMQGKLDLDNELIDMEIHLSPELGGNLTLLSTLANPAAGALVFLTQQLFKDEMRSNSYKSYRALGNWEDFEMVEFDVNEESVVN